MTFPITNAAVTSTMPKHTYTIMMTTANHGTPTFLHHVQQSYVDLVFIGLAGIFFRKTKLSNWPWNHVFVLSGEGDAAKLPQAASLRQKYSFTVESDSEFIKENDELSEDIFGNWSEFQAQDPHAQEPQDLKDVLSLWSHIRKNRLSILNFVNFATPTAQAQYEELLSTAKRNHDLKLHLFGKARDVDKDVEETVGKDVEKDTEQFTHFSLISFPSEKAYGKYLVSNEYKKLIEDDGCVKEGMVLTTEMRLPHKSRPINPSDWVYGNPHEPYGEDWFG